MPGAAVSVPFKFARLNKADVSRRSFEGHIWLLVAVANSRDNSLYNVLYNAYHRILSYLDKQGSPITANNTRASPVEDLYFLFCHSFFKNSFANEHHTEIPVSRILSLKS